MIFKFIANIFGKINDGRIFLFEKFRANHQDKKRIRDFFKARRKRLSINNEVI